MLTVDVQLQALMEQALQKGLTQAKAYSGVAIAMDPRTGEVLGMVSLPTYDNNLFADGITADEYDQLINDEQRPLVNHAISALYPPGSTFKIVTASAALQEGVIDERTRLGDSFDGRVDGLIYVDNRFFPDDPRYAQPFYCWIHAYGTGHYQINVREALAVSCDVFMYQVAGGYRKTFEGVGIDKMVEYTEQFGFGDVTGIDLPGENPGLVPTPRWKRLTYAETWAAGDTYNMAIGQGAMLATPLQVLNATAAIANGGQLYKPQIVRQIVDVDGNVVDDFKPELIRDLPVDPDYVAIVQDGMWGAVNFPNGTAKALSVPGRKRCRQDRHGGVLRSENRIAAQQSPANPCLDHRLRAVRGPGDRGGGLCLQRRRRIGDCAACGAGHPARLFRAEEPAAAGRAG